MRNTFLFILILIAGVVGQAAESQPVVGREAAARILNNREPAQNYSVGVGAGHYLALHAGRYMGSQSYEWSKKGQEEDVGKGSFGVTYRVGEWENSADLNVRIDYAEYSLGGEPSSKLSFLPLLTFPDASSRFPLYFGAGLGLGVFFKQLERKSPLSLDLQLVLGARFFDVFENTGFFIESGIKNHLHILSTGQLNGTYLTTGLVFTF